MTKKEKIPKIIHQIWFGTNPKPVKWMKNIEDFAKHHGYKYMFWDEDAIHKEFDKEFKANKDLRDVRDSFAHEPSGVADLYRYLILLKYGGIYIDSDVVVVRDTKFNDFVSGLDCDIFFAWEEAGDHKDRREYHTTTSGLNRMLANSVIGSTPNHKFFKDSFEEIFRNFKAGKGKDTKYWAWIRTGPALVTEVWNKNGSNYPLLQAFPMRYFFPRHWHGITDPDQHIYDLKDGKIPDETMLYQYGYSTNKFDKIFKKLEESGKANGHTGGARLRRTQSRKARRGRRSRTRRRA